MGCMESDVKDLTIISCTAGFRDRGIVELVRAGKVRKIIASHIGTTPDVVKAYHAGEIEVELVPQGTLAEQTAVGRRRPGRLSDPHRLLGRMMAEGKQHIEVDGKTYLLEKALRADVALVRAHDGDTWGNLRYRGTAANYNPLCAACADYTIAEVEYLYSPGEIAPESVQTPGTLRARCREGRSRLPRLLSRLPMSASQGVTMSA